MADIEYEWTPERPDGSYFPIGEMQRYAGPGATMRAYTDVQVARGARWAAEMAMEQQQILTMAFAERLVKAGVTADLNDPVMREILQRLVQERQAKKEAELQDLLNRKEADRIEAEAMSGRAAAVGKL